MPAYRPTAAEALHAADDAERRDGRVERLLVELNERLAALGRE